MGVRVLQSATIAIFLTVFIVSLLRVSNAQVMTSSHYQIESDSVNVGGGRSTSTNYIQESTVGEVGTGISTSTNYEIKAGYQQMQEVYLALSGGTAVNMSPDIPGVTGGTSTGATAFHVTTDSLGGYQLSVASPNSPAMRSGVNTISDYVPAGSIPDFAFATGPADAHFGFSPKGVDVVPRFRDNGSVCGSGSLTTTGACWDGLATTPTAIAQGAGPNAPSGATTTINFEVGIGGSVVQPAGAYIATTTVTAVAL